MDYTLTTTISDFCLKFSEKISETQEFTLIEELRHENFKNATQPHVHASWELRLGVDNVWNVVPPETVHDTSPCLFSLEIDVHRIMIIDLHGGLMTNKMIPSNLIPRHLAPELLFFLRQSQNTTPLSRHLFSAALYALLDILQLLSRQTEKHPVLNLAQVVRRYLIHKYFNASLSLNDVAQAFGTSSQYLNRVLRRAKMPSIHDLLIELRLEAAEKFLCLGRYTVKDVARLTGWNSPLYFSNCFRKRFGCPPGTYSHKMQQEGPANHEDTINTYSFR